MELETARLQLRPCRVDDGDVLHLMWTDADVRRYLWDDLVIPRAQADAVVRSAVADWETRGYGLSLVSLSGTGLAIGFCGLRPADWCDCPEMLFGLLPSHWGQGLATEAARAVLDDAFDRVGADEVVAATDVPNAASVRVLTRLGMTLDRQGALHGLDTLFFSARRPLRATQPRLRKLNPVPPCGGGG